MPGLAALATLSGVNVHADEPATRGIHVEFGTVRFDVPTHRVVGSHFVTSPAGVSIREFDYYLEAAPGDTAITLDLPEEDLAVRGSELSRDAGDEFVKRSMRIVNQPRRSGEAKSWTRPDRSLEATVIAVTYNTYSDPPRERASASVIVVWKVRDAVSGELLYQTSTPGGDTMDGRGQTCIRRAFVDAMERLLDDEAFVAVMSRE